MKSVGSEIRRGRREMRPDLKESLRKRRHRRVRAKIFGTAERPRLNVSRSLQHIYARSEEHTSELQSHRDLHSFPTRRSSDLREPKKATSSAGSGEDIRYGRAPSAQRIPQPTAHLR